MFLFVCTNYVALNGCIGMNNVEACGSGDFNLFLRQVYYLGTFLSVGRKLKESLRISRLITENRS